ncbi:MAG: 16S rRNA (cytosine(1402)-N(4))-methyltransferase RsmH [Myxococcota bacterium]
MNVVNIVPMPPSSRPPPSTWPPPETPHVTVLKDEVVNAVCPRAGGVYADCTLGAGGHTEALLAAGAGHVIGFDRDETALALARRRLERFAPRVDFVHAPFSRLGAELNRLGMDRLDGVVADLGVSSMQIDDPSRGMSFRGVGPIDMRMDPSGGETARDLIERLDVDALTELIGRLGEERRARRVARCIKEALAAGRLETTSDLRRAVVKAVGPSRQGNVDPATRTFQALRIAVNTELHELDQLIDAAATALRDGGVVAIISFHSLEDRIVKRKLREAPSSWHLRGKKPVVVSEAERVENPRARSAKLRVASRVARET